MELKKTNQALIPAIIKLPVVIQIAPPRPKNRPKKPERIHPITGTTNDK